MLGDTSIRNATANAAANNVTVTVTASATQRIYLVYATSSSSAGTVSASSIDVRQASTTVFLKQGAAAATASPEFNPSVPLAITPVNTALNVVFTMTGSTNTTGYIAYFYGP